MAERIEVLGCPIDPLTMDETIREVARIVEGCQPPVQHAVINALKTNLVADDPRLAGVIRACGLVNADGQSILWAARLLGKRIPRRVAGIDLMNRLLAEAEGRGWRVYFIGATQEVLARFLSAAREEHPHLQIAGSRDGYFDERDESEIAAAVREAGPDLLFVGISSPKKEFFLARNLEKMGVPFAMGVGGAFDVGARVVRRAPVWMQRAGLEWFHRLLQEPRRMWRRYVFGNARFAGRVIRELVRRP